MTSVSVQAELIVLQGVCLWGGGEQNSAVTQHTARYLIFQPWLQFDITKHWSLAVIALDRWKISVRAEF